MALIGRKQDACKVEYPIGRSRGRKTGRRWDTQRTQVGREEERRPARPASARSPQPPLILFPIIKADVNAEDAVVFHRVKVRPRRVGTSDQLAMDPRGIGTLG